jgi:hypothetical protein
MKNVYEYMEVYIFMYKLVSKVASDESQWKGKLPGIKVYTMLLYVNVFVYRYVYLYL